jgi:hypothetical protein
LNNKKFFIMAEAEESVEKVAEALYDAACAARSKDGKSPREIGAGYDKLWPQPKAHYQAMARWHIAQTATQVERLGLARNTLQNIINSCVHPETAYRAVMVNLEPIRATLKKL